MYCAGEGDYGIGKGCEVGYDGCYTGDIVMLVSFRVKIFMCVDCR